MERAELLRLAKAGAAARLTEIDQERQALLRQFPDLRGTRTETSGSSGQSAATGGRRRKRSTMSAAQRKAVSERMRKYWAARRGEGKDAQKASQAAGKKARRKTSAKSAKRGARKMSAAARKRIAAAQKARWAEWRKKKGAA
jgi:hypothetical protein